MYKVNGISRKLLLEGNRGKLPTLQEVWSTATLEALKYELQLEHGDQYYKEFDNS